MGAPLKRITDAVSRFNKVVAPQGSEAAGLAAKQANIDAVKAADAPAPTSAPARTGTKINPNAKFGDKAGEQRIDTDSMTKPLGSYKKGTSYVPKTGTYKLHEGERVVTKGDNMKMGMHGAMGSLAGHGGMPKPKKVIKEIRTRKSDNGKYIHEHHHSHPEHHKMEEHVSDSKDAMMQHMASNMGDDAPGGAAADAAGAPPMPPQGGADAMAQDVGM